MINIFIGIDPSINSTGICMQIYENDSKVNEYFYIIKPNKLTKKEKEAQKRNKDNFKYILYKKEDLSKIEDNHMHEYKKTENINNLIDSIYDFVMNKISEYNYSNIYILQEGISYGSSIRTKSVYDLAGINYLLRYKFMKNPNILFIIGTPSEIKKFTTGKGNSNKDIIIQIFSALYPKFELPKIDDICDSFFMAEYAHYLYKMKG